MGVEGGNKAVTLRGKHFCKESMIPWGMELLGSHAASTLPWLAEMSPEWLQQGAGESNQPHVLARLKRSKEERSTYITEQFIMTPDLLNHAIKQTTLHGL